MGEVYNQQNLEALKAHIICGILVDNMRYLDQGAFEMGIMGFWLGDICASFMPFVICGIYFWSGKWKKSGLAVAK